MKASTWTHEAHSSTASSKSAVLNVLMVAALLGVLACLVVNALNYTERASAKNRVALGMSMLREAFLGYHTKYLKLPITPPDETSVVESRGGLLTVLLGTDPVTNPENIVFLGQSAHLRANEGVVKNAQGELEMRDPWGNLFRMHIDVNNDGTIPNPSGGKDGADAQIAAVPPGIALYSAGPDGNFETWADNFKTWEKAPVVKQKKAKAPSDQ